MEGYSTRKAHLTWTQQSGLYIEGLWVAIRMVFHCMYVPTLGIPCPVIMYMSEELYCYARSRLHSSLKSSIECLKLIIMLQIVDKI